MVQNCQTESWVELRTRKSSTKQPGLLVAWGVQVEEREMFQFAAKLPCNITFGKAFRMTPSSFKTVDDIDTLRFKLF